VGFACRVEEAQDSLLLSPVIWLRYSFDELLRVELLRVITNQYPLLGLW